MVKPFQRSRLAALLPLGAHALKLGGSQDDEKQKETVEDPFVPFPPPPPQKIPIANGEKTVSFSPPASPEHQDRKHGSFLRPSASSTDLAEDHERFRMKSLTELEGVFMGPIAIGTILYFIIMFWMPGNWFRLFFTLFFWGFAFQQYFTNQKDIAAKNLIDGDVVKDSVLESEAVLQAIERYDAANRADIERGFRMVKKKTKSGRIIEEKIAIVRGSKYAQELFNKYRPKHNKNVLNFLYVIVGWALRILYPDNRGIDEKFTRLFDEKYDGLTVLLMTHRSMIDFTLLTWWCVHNDLPIPVIVAGENLNKPGFGMLLRGAGAQFIRRTFGGQFDSDLYKAITYATIQELVKSQEMVWAFFPEGTRSRTYLTLAPKTGMLKVPMNMIKEGELSDARLVPMSPAYQKPLELRTFAQNLQGVQKKPESTLGMLYGCFSSVTRPLFGYECYGGMWVGVGKEQSVMDYFRDRVREQVVTSASNEDVQAMKNCNSVEDLRDIWSQKLEQKERDISTLEDKEVDALTMSIGFKVLHEATVATPILSVPLVNTVLWLNKGEMAKEELTEAYKWLKLKCSNLGGYFPKEFESEHADAEEVAHVMENILFLNDDGKPARELKEADSTRETIRKMMRRVGFLAMFYYANMGSVVGMGPWVWRAVLTGVAGGTHLVQRSLVDDEIADEDTLNMELTIQRNQLLHVFVYDGVMSVALYKILRQKGGLDDKGGGAHLKTAAAADAATVQHRCLNVLQV